MDNNKKHEFAPSSPEAKNDNESQQEKEAAVIDMDKTVMPNGDMLYSARLHDDEGNDNFVSATLMVDGGMEVVLNGVRTSDTEEVSKVVELLGIGNETIQPLSAAGYADDDVAARAMAQETAVLTQQINEINHSTDPTRDISSSIVERQVAQVAERVDTTSQDVGQQIINETTNRTESIRQAALAEEYVRDGYTEALADALRASGDSSGAQRMEQNELSAKRENLEDNKTLREIGRDIDRAMNRTGLTVDDLNDEVEERKAA